MTAPPRVIQRIRANVELTETGCWLWRRSKVNGYGQIGWHENGVRIGGLTHRLMYEATYGPIPDGLQADHQCHDPKSCHMTVASECPHRACCNPAHLVPVTNRANVLRGGGLAAVNAAKTECPQGHSYSTSNTYTTPDGSRQCRICRREHVTALRRQIARAG